MSAEQPQVVSADPTVPEQGAQVGAEAEAKDAVDPAKADPADADPAKEPARAEPPPRAEPAEAGTDEAKAAEPTPAKDEPAKDRPAKDEPAKDEHAKDESAKVPGAPTKNDEKDTKEDKADGTAGKDAAAKPEQPIRDRWAAFAPEPERPLNRRQRFGRAIGRALIHEWTLASFGSLVLAVLMTWPTLRYPRHTLPQDIWDPTLQAWQMAWSGHILLTDPAQLWNSNTFFPERLSFAFSDTLLGYAPAGMIGEGPMAAIVRYNIMFVLAHALATLGAYALVRQLGAGRTGAVVAAAAYTYAPWMLSQAGHLHIVSNGGIPLALAMLARGHGYSFRHGYRDQRRHAGWALAGWLVAAWQLSLGFGIGLVFAYVLGLLGVVSIAIWYGRKVWRRGVKRRFGARLALTDLVGGLIFAATGALLSLPYFDVAHLHPEAERTVDALRAYSPPVSGFFIAPAESRLWGGLHEDARAGLPWAPEMTLLPGYVLYGLALAGLFFSIWKVRHRLLLLAAVLVTGVLAMGPRFFGGTYTYLPLFEHLPGWDGLRTPGRLMLWTTLLLGVLAAGAVSAFVRRLGEISANRVPPRPAVWLRLATFIPLALVLVEGLNTTPHPVVPLQPAVMRTDPGPILVLPSTLKIDQNVMIWSTSRFQPVVNGGSGFTPTRQEETRKVTESFPDQASVDYLRELGVKTVVLLRDQLAGTPWESAADHSTDGLNIQREEAGNTIIFRL